MYDLVAVGEVVLDVIAPGLQAAGMKHAEIEVRAGGVPVNAAIAAARSGSTAAVIGRVGADAAGAALDWALAHEGVKPILVVDDERATGTHLRAGGAIVTDRGASAVLAPSDIPDSLDARAVLVSGYALLHEATAGAGRAAIERAGGSAEHVAVVTPAAALLREAGRRRFDERTAGVTAIVANRDEALVLTALEPRDAVVALAKRYGLAAVTAGRDGAFASLGGPVVHVRVPTRHGGHVVGAGDAFAGALLGLLARGAELEAAVRCGCAEAGRFVR